ncbi:MAG: hypothetical protein AB1656_19480 [Candidatus Omnitrophota bacterium]
MPEKSWWESFFHPAAILNKMELTSDCLDVVEYGCGTFGRSRPNHCRKSLCC